MKTTIAMAAALAALAAGPAAAQQTCFASPAQAGSWLAEEYGEHLVAVLPSALSGGWIMIYVEAGESWTAMQVDQAGEACMVDVGPAPMMWEMPPIGEPS
jgi:hypothetical protein